MKSVEQYPEYQVESGNIQFLTRKEHLEAHDGSWQNPTNWFFDPISKEKIDFGDGPFIPCKTFDLSNPVPLDFLRSGVVGETDDYSAQKGIMIEPVDETHEESKNNGEVGIMVIDLHTAVVKAVNQLIEQKDELLPVFRANVEKALSASNSAAVAEVDAKLLAIQKELLKKADARQDFGDLADQIDALRDEKQRLLLEDANNTGLQQQLKTIEDFLAEQQEAVTEYEEALVRKLISKITVFDDKLVVEFKSGLETEVKM